MLDTELMFQPIGVTFLLGIITVFLYWYSTRNFDFWKKQNVPYIEPIPFLGTAVELLSNPFHEIVQQRYRKYGRVYGHFEAGQPVLSIGEPELLRDILIKDFHIFPYRKSNAIGDKIFSHTLVNAEKKQWKRMRTVITPTFTSGKIKRMSEIFKECANTLVQNFRTATEKGTPVNVLLLYGAFTMDNDANSTFSTKIDSLNDPKNKFVQMALKAFGQHFSWRFALMFFTPWLVRMFSISMFEPGVAEFFRDVTLQIVEERKRTGQTREDYVQILMDIEKETSKDPKSEKESEDVTVNYGDDLHLQPTKTATKKSLTPEEFVGMSATFFLAGYGTTSSALSFASYELALNQDVQDKAFAEIVEALEEANGELTYDAIQNMKYLDNIISETLRLYPPTVRLERISDADYEVGDTGIKIPKGTLVTIPCYAMHRDPKLFPNPEKFDPDRFKPEERAKRHRYSYLPFGGGPRTCVGMRFALMTMKVCLAHVIANFKIVRCPETKVPLEFWNGQRMLRAKDIILSMQPRKNSPLAN